VLAQIRREFPDDVRLIYRHFPLVNIHDKAQLAAEAAEAAGAQGKFWEMHELLYEQHTAWANLPPADFRKLLDQYAGQIGLNKQQFSADLDGGKFTQKVKDAFNAAVNIPLPGTPFLLFNGVPYQGPQEHWAFAALIKLEQLKERQFAAAPPDIIDPFRQYFATLHTVRGNVVIQLFAEKAPLTVNNFVFLARKGWFDGVTFHRVIPGFVVQAGDPTGTGFGGPGYFIPDEINPDLTFDGAGWVGMANAGQNTNGSQFFITLDPASAIPYAQSHQNTTPVPAATETAAYDQMVQTLRNAQANLNGKYTLFGKVIQGMDVVNKLTPRDPSADPEAPPGDAILSVTIEEK
jgi:cyclophilin family peptidyl-prolyl cis-trans isomerase